MSVLFLCMNCLRAADELNRLVHRCIILNYLEGMPRISPRNISLLYRSYIIPIKMSQISFLYHNLYNSCIIPMSFILKIPPIVLYHRFNAKCQSHFRSDIVHYISKHMLFCFVFMKMTYISDENSDELDQTYISLRPVVINCVYLL